MKRILLWGIANAACACALLVGCAKAPQQEITNAQNALEAAKAAKAPVFAEDQFKVAQALLDSALADIRAQNSKSPLSHDYAKAKKMLLEATAGAEAAIAAVPAKKAKIFDEAKALFDKIKPALDESNKLLEYPIQKNNKEAVVLRAKLSAVAASLPEDMSKVSDEALYMTRTTLGVTVTVVQSIKASVLKLNPSKKIVPPAPTPEQKKGKKKRRGCSAAAKRDARMELGLRCIGSAAFFLVVLTLIALLFR
jgi:hypothetical protein